MRVNEDTLATKVVLQAPDVDHNIGPLKLHALCTSSAREGSVRGHIIIYDDWQAFRHNLNAFNGGIQADILGQIGLVRRR